MKRSELTPAEILFMDVRRSGIQRKLIAEEAGMTPSELSQFINSSRRLHPESEKKIRDAIKTLHKRGMEQ